MTLHALVRAAEREERLRRAIYPRRIADGRMTEEQSNHEIQCMAEIAALLRNQLAVQQPHITHGQEAA